MELQQLRYFLSASHTLSFAETANFYQVSRQAISSSIRNLEKELKVDLFNRAHGKMSLTPEGEVFAARAEETVALFGRIAVQFSQPAAASISLAVDSFLLNPYSEILTSLLEYEKLPRGCAVQFSQEAFSRIYHRVINRTCDIGLVRTMKHDYPETEYKVLREARLGCIASAESEFGDRETISVKDLRDKLLILPGGFEQRYEPIIGTISPNVLDKSQFVIIDEISVATNSVRQGIGLGVTDFEGQAKRKEINGIVHLPFDDEALCIYDVVFYRKDSTNISQLEDFVDWMIENDCWRSWRLSHAEK